MPKTPAPTLSADQIRTLLSSLNVTPESLVQALGLAATGKAAPDRAHVYAPSKAESDDDFLARRILELAAERPGVTVNEIVGEIGKTRAVAPNYRQTVTTKANAMAGRGLLVTAVRRVGRRMNRCIYLPEHVRFQGDVDGHHPRADRLS